MRFCEVWSNRFSTRRYANAPIQNSKFKIQNSKFKIKDSHPQGVGLEPSPKNVNRPQGAGLEPNKHFFSFCLLPSAFLVKNKRCLRQA
jgi:hypothetical protein